MRSPSRRGLLAGLVTLAALAPFRRIGPAQGKTRLDQAIRADRLLARTLARLGEACLPLAADFGVPATTALAQSYERAAAAGIPLARWIDDLARADFRNRDVVAVEGWILSRSEVGLFLYARRLAA